MVCKQMVTIVSGVGKQEEKTTTNMRGRKEAYTVTLASKQTHRHSTQLQMWEIQMHGI